MQTQRLRARDAGIDMALAVCVPRRGVNNVDVVVVLPRFCGADDYRLGVAPWRDPLKSLEKFDVVGGTTQTRTTCRVFKRRNYGNAPPWEYTTYPRE